MVGALISLTIGIARRTNRISRLDGQNNGDLFPPIWDGADPGGRSNQENGAPPHSPSHHQHQHTDHSHHGHSGFDGSAFHSHHHHHDAPQPHHDTSHHGSHGFDSGASHGGHAGGFDGGGATHGGGFDGGGHH